MNSGRLIPGQIDAGVVVPVNDQPTGFAPIDPVRQLQVFLDGSAAGTGLGTGVPSVRLHHLNTILLGFVLNLPNKLPESLFPDGFGQIPVLHHAPDVQMFHNNPGGPGFYDAVGSLVCIVVADVRNVLVYRADFVDLTLDVATFSQGAAEDWFSLPCIA